MGNNKKYVVDANFIKEAYILKLSLVEFLLLLYFENVDDPIFDLEIISQKLKIEINDILFAFNSLINKKLISLISEKNDSGKRYDQISLEGFYNELNANIKKDNRKNMKEDIFTKFENEFKRPLAGVEIEFIKAWVEKMYDESLILRALEEAIYNGAVNIRYIDTVLYEWSKKGYKTREDVENGLKKSYENKKLEDTGIFDYNWLDEYDK